MLKNQFDWKNNLLEYLSNFVVRETAQTIDNKNLAPERYYQVLNQKSVRFINSFDFASLTGQIPLNLLDLNDLHKQTVEDFCSKICLGLPEFAYFLKLLSKMLSDFETAQGVPYGQDYEFETLEARVIYELYEFVKALFSQRFPDKGVELEQRVAHTDKTSNIPTRPNCIECGSNHVTSNGALWFCQSCGRKFSKRPRRQQKP